MWEEITGVYISLLWLYVGFKVQDRPIHQALHLLAFKFLVTKYLSSAAFWSLSVAVLYRWCSLYYVINMFWWCCYWWWYDNPQCCTKRALHAPNKTIKHKFKILKHCKYRNLKGQIEKICLSMLPKHNVS